MTSHASVGERLPTSATELPGELSCLASDDVVLECPSNFDAKLLSKSCEADPTPQLRVNETAEPYQYLPLEPRQIRILVLLPVRVGEPLSARLVHRSLSPPLEYTALSYCWGPANFSEAIFLPQTLQITTTLHYALSRMRNPEHGIAIWADAICIDQNNTLEKET